MAQIELVMPKMGESIMEATILSWLKQEGDSVEADETILEIATDKVDSEIPSPVSGKIVKLLFQVNDVVEIGKAIAIIETEESANSGIKAPSDAVVEEKKIEKVAPEKDIPSPAVSHVAAAESFMNPIAIAQSQEPQNGNVKSSRFYSPLVKNIAKTEGISFEELDSIAGSGANGRLTKADILQYVSSRSGGQYSGTTVAKPVQQNINPAKTGPSISISGNDEIIEMDRMRKLIADHMVMSKRTSPHVTSFVEADVTNIVDWRNKVKSEFTAKHKEKITYTPIFIEAVVKAIQDFPMVNISLDGTKIIKKSRINIGMATALPSGNLIVPVIKDADQQNLLGITKQVNELANRARNNALKPEDIQEGTFTITNVGTFGNVMGTPIINQPQVAILAIGAIRKKPAVIETEKGDFIGIRQMMFMSLSYDHRVVDGFLGGSFLRKIADYLEAFDVNQKF